MGRRWFLLPLLLLALAVAWQLFAEPIVGLADSGDFPRIMLTPRPAVRYRTQADVDDAFAYLVRTYRLEPDCTVDYWYISSETLLLRAALLVSPLLSKDGLFDVRVLGLVHALAFLGGLTWLVLCLARASRGLALTAALAAAVIFADVGYVSYLNSFYSEPAGLIFFVLTLAAAADLALADGPLRASSRRVVVFVASATLFVFAKPEYALFGVFLAVFVYRCLRGGAGPDRASRRTALAPAACLVGASLACLLFGGNRNLRVYNVYATIFTGLLDGSPDPVADLAELGLPADQARYNGVNCFAADCPMKDEAYRRDLAARTGHGQVLRFYLTHPRRWLGLLERTARGMYVTRVPYLGNFDRGAGQPAGAKSSAFTHWSRLRERLFPRSLVFIVLFALLNVLVVAVAYRLTAQRPARLALELQGLLLLMATTVFVLVPLATGVEDMEKHLFLVNLVFDVCLALLPVEVGVLLLPAVAALRPGAWPGARRALGLAALPVVPLALLVLMFPPSVRRSLERWPGALIRRLAIEDFGPRNVSVPTPDQPEGAVIWLRPARPVPSWVEVRCDGVPVPTTVAADGRFVTACLPPGALAGRDSVDVGLCDRWTRIGSRPVRFTVARPDAAAAAAGRE
jgi:hypothetical protein